MAESERQSRKEDLIRQQADRKAARLVAQILAAVDRLQPRGDTPLARTIAEVGKEIIRRRATGSPYERQVMVVLTDGEDNTNRGAKGVREEMRKLRAQQVEIIAFGYQGEGQYMRDSATRFFSPDNAQDIRRGLNVIAAEIGDTSDIVVDEATRARMQGSSPSAMQTPAIEAEETPAVATPHPKGTGGTHISVKIDGKPGGFPFLSLLFLMGVGYFIFGRGKRR